MEHKHRSLAERVMLLHELFQLGTNPVDAVAMVREEGWSHAETMEAIEVMERLLEEKSAFQAEIPDAEIVDPPLMEKHSKECNESTLAGCICDVSKDIYLR